MLAFALSVSTTFSAATVAFVAGPQQTSARRVAGYADGSGAALAKYQHGFGTGMTKSIKMRRAGNESGAVEAKRAVAVLGRSVTKDDAHLWLNRAVAQGIAGKNAEDAQAWEWGCRIMFMLKMRPVLVD
jgi:hypothetical protein